jgi:5'-3' exonuclease
MILVDFNGLLFQYIHSCISFKKPELQEDGRYKADDIIRPVKSLIISELFNIQNNNPRYGNVVLCVDNVLSGNWRKDIYKSYKASRVRDSKDPIPLKEIFRSFNNLLRQIDDNTPWKVVSVDRAEGDDCILTLASCIRNEDILIVSSDKDMIQAQKNPMVKQYSPLMKKWISYKTKDVDNLDTWLMEHVILGDATDDVPRIFDETEFTDEFKCYIKTLDIPQDVESFNSLDTKNEVIEKFLSTNPGCSVYTKLRIGPKTVQKMIRDGSIKEFISKYKTNYERNRKLVLAEGIPSDIREKIISCYSVQKDVRVKDIDTFVNYLYDCGLGDLTSNLPSCFRCQPVTIDDFF